VLMENPFKDGVFVEIKNILFKEYKNKYIEKAKNMSKEEIKDLIWGKIITEYKNYSSQNSYKAYDWDLIVKKAGNSLNLKSEINVASLVEKYCKRPYIKSYNDGEKLLEYLKNKNNNLKVITNGYYKYQFPVLKALNLSKYFSEIITCDKAKAAKPEKDIFLMAVAANESINWVHIGDSLLMDVYGANKLGAKTVLVDRNLDESLSKLNIQIRSKEKGSKNYIIEKAKKEKSFNKLNYHDSFIYPDYLVKSLIELFNNFI
ncbi:MAG: HAD family hydrolase, partial [Halanaerobiales bacterium]